MTSDATARRRTRQELENRMVGRLVNQMRPFLASQFGVLCSSGLSQQQQD